MKILYVTTVGETMIFFEELIRRLIQEGNTVDIATNEQGSMVPGCYREWNCRIYRLDCTRAVLDFGNIRAMKQLRKLVSKNRYDIVHCHTPIAAACVRIACKSLRKKGVKVIYTAHGFHFFRGAPVKNWLLFYPAEKFLSYWTDCLITINREDYRRAKRKFHAQKTEYVPGVGVDVEKYQSPDFIQNEDNSCVPFSSWRRKKRAELGLGADDFVIASVGELNENKNHGVVIEAIARLNDKKIKYLICGQGEQKDKLLDFAQKLGLQKQVFLLGFRNDIKEILWISDLFVFPSKREGLGLAAIEAMAAGLALVTSNVHGINDYSVQKKTGYKCNPNDISGFQKAIFHLIHNKEQRKSIGQENRKKVFRYDRELIIPKMKKIYYDEKK